MTTHVALVVCLVIMAAGTTGSDVNKRAAQTLGQLTVLTNQLSSKVASLKSQIAAIKTDADRKQATIDTLKQRIDTEDQFLANLTRDKSAKEQQLAALDPYCKNNVAALNNRTSLLEHAVAFTVRFSQDSILNHTAKVGSRYYMKFDYVQYQVGGNNYNNATGIFTAPAAGLYLFFLTIQRLNPQADDCVEAYIRRNTNQLVAMASACPPGYQAASNMGLVWLRRGDHVNVQTYDADDIFGHVHTTFSGVRVSPH